MESRRRAAGRIHPPPYQRGLFLRRRPLDRRPRAGGHCAVEDQFPGYRRSGDVAWEAGRYQGAGRTRNDDTFRERG